MTINYAIWKTPLVYDNINRILNLLENRCTFFFIERTEESRSMTSLLTSIWEYKCHAVSLDRPRSSWRLLDMLSHSLLVNTGNVLALSEARHKASQNSTDEVSWQLLHNVAFLITLARSVRPSSSRDVDRFIVLEAEVMSHTLVETVLSLSHSLIRFSWLRRWRSSWMMNRARWATRQLYVYRFSAIRPYSARECFLWAGLINSLSITIVDQWEEGHESAGRG